MGQLLTLLHGDGGAGVFIDFENVRPSADEQASALYELAMERVMQGRQLLETLRGYTGCAEHIRAAMSAPRDEAVQVETFQALLPNIDSIKAFFDLSLQLEELLPNLLTALLGADAMQNQQALAKALADVLEFALAFDQAKMMIPGVQNDFSYYRRSLGPMANNPAVELRVSEAEANLISMFIAQNQPIMKSLSNAAAGAFRENNEVAHVLSQMANICLGMLTKHKAQLQTEDIQLYVCRVMTAAIVLYDHVDPMGAFARSSPVHTKKCVQCLKAQGASAASLLSSIKYSTIHFNDSSTPQNITSLLD